MEYSTDIIDTWQISYNDVERVQTREDLNQEVLDRIAGDVTLSNEIVERDGYQWQLTSDNNLRIPKTIYVSQTAYIKGSVYKGYETKTLQSRYVRRGETPHITYTLGGGLQGVGLTTDLYVDGDLYIINDCYDGYNTDTLTITATEFKFGNTSDGQGYTTSNLVLDGDLYVRGNVWIGDNPIPYGNAKEYPDYVWGSCNLAFGAVKEQHLDLSEPTIKLGVATYTPQYTLDVAGTIHGLELYENNVTLSNIYRKIADSNIDASQIVSGFLDVARIQDGSLSNVKIADLDAAKLTGTLNVARIANGSLSNVKIADLDAAKLTGTLNVDRIAALSIGNAKISDVDASKITNFTTTVNAAAGWVEGTNVVYLNTVTDSVGIGTPTPTQKLDVVGQVKATSFAGDGSAITALNATQLTGTINMDRIATGAITGTKLANGTITTTQIAANTIVDGNIANTTITGGKLVNGTITTTQIAANTIVDGNIANTTITGGKIANTTITGGKLVNGTITTTQIAANTIVDGNIANATITGGKLVNGTITTTQIAANTIVDGNIANTTITGGKLVNGTITTTQIAANTIVDGNIANATITGSKLANATITGTQIAANTIASDNIISLNAAKLTGTLPNTVLTPVTAFLETNTTTSITTYTYPPAAITNYQASLTGQAYGNGTYIITSSSRFDATNYQEWRAFNKTNADANAWISGNSAYTVTSGIGVSARAESITAYQGGTYQGEWLQIDLPNAIYVTSFKITNRNSGSRGEPRNFRLFGSRDGTTWVQLFDKIDETPFGAANVIRTYTIQQNFGYYDHYRIAINKTNVITTELYVSIGELEFIQLENLHNEPTVTLNTFEVKGDGSALKNLNASQLTTGTIPRSSILPAKCRFLEETSSVSTNTTYTYIMPPLGLTQDYTNITSATYANGEYGALSSGALDYRFPAWKGFNKTNANSTDCWISKDRYTLAGNIGTHNDPNILTGTYQGEWLQIKLATPVNVTAYAITTRNDGSTRGMPRDWRLFGSTDGITWIQIDDRTSIAALGGNVKTNYTVTGNTGFYDYYRIAINKTNTVGTETWAGIGDMEFTVGQFIHNEPMTTINAKAFQGDGSLLTSLTAANLTGTVNVANGGTGLTTLTGYAKGSGTTISAVTTIPVADGGTGLTTLTGYAKGSGTTISAVTTIPVSDGGTGLTTLTGYAKGSGTTISAVTTIPVSDGGTGAVTLTGYVKGSGTAALTAAATIPTTDLSGTISETQIATDAVTTIKIKDLNVTTAKIADLNVTTGKIADLNVTTAKIADGAVTNAKIDTVDVSKITNFNGTVTSVSGWTEGTNVVYPTTLTDSVGIGTSNPTARLHIVQPTATTGDIVRVDDETSDTTPFIIKDNGNVGIGTTTPSTTLQVNGEVTATKYNGNGSGLTNVLLTTSGERAFTFEDPSPLTTYHPVLGSTNTYDTGLCFRVVSNPPDSSALFQVRGSGQGVRLFCDNVGYFGSPQNSLYAAAETTARPHILSGANVGIEITAPTAKLHIVQPTATTGDIVRVDDETSDTTPFIIKDNGRVGIGTITPSQALNVIGNIQVSSQYIAPLGSISTPAYSFTGDLDTGIYSPAANQCAITTNGTQRLIITNNSVQAVMPIYASSGSAALPAYTFTGDTDCGIFSPITDHICISTNGTERLRVNSSGNIGISTTTPIAKLHIVQPTATTGDIVRVDDETSDTTPFIIKDDGNVGIGTATPQEKLHTYGNILVDNITTYADAPYPPAPMTGEYTTYSGLLYGNGTWRATESSRTSVSFDAYYAFNYNYKLFGWISDFTKYNTTTGAYVGTVSTNGYLGEYIQLESPSTLKLYSFSIKNTNNTTLGVPKKIRIFVSTDGTTWLIVNDYTLTQTYGVETKYLFRNGYDAISGFRFIRIVINETYPNSDSRVNIQMLKFYGEGQRYTDLIKTTSNEKVLLAENGLIGAGTNTPNAKMHIFSTKEQSIIVNTKNTNTTANEFPPQALTFSITKISGQSYGNGLYEIGAIQQTGSNYLDLLWQAFDNNKGLIGSYQDYDVPLYNASTGVAIQYAKYTYINGYIGYYLTFKYTGEHGEKLIINRFDIASPTSGTIICPVDFKLFGQNDDNTWTELFEWTAETWSLNQTKSYNFFNETPYRTYAFAVAKMTGATQLGIVELYFYGYPDVRKTIDTINANLILAGETYGGRVGIGTATPDARLNVFSDNEDIFTAKRTHATFPYMIRATTTDLFVKAGGAYYGRPIVSDGNNLYRGNRSAGYIEWATEIGLVGTNYFLSDIRRKQNIQPTLQKTLNILDTINFVSFDWKTEEYGKSIKCGVIAQQLQELEPELVDELSDGYLSVNPVNLLVYTCKAVQELSAIVKQQQEQINLLLEKINIPM